MSKKSDQFSPEVRERTVRMVRERRPPLFSTDNSQNFWSLKK